MLNISISIHFQYLRHLAAQDMQNMKVWFFQNANYAYAVED
jgi:hypothetical protein